MSQDFSPPRILLPSRRYGGYIFDLDGTLVDSMPLHFRAWQTALRTAGAPDDIFPWSEFFAHGGMAAVDIVRDLNRKFALHLPPQQTADSKRTCYATLSEQEVLPVIPETLALVHALRAEHIPYAIGTGSTLSGALQTLRAARIDALFPIIVTPDDVPRGKPAPDIFLKAAERMGVPPSECVVFEDAAPGLRAAAAAGMTAVAIPPSPPPITSVPRKQNAQW